MGRVVIDSIDDHALTDIVNRSPEYAAYAETVVVGGLVYAKRIAPDAAPIGRGYIAGLSAAVFLTGGTRSAYVISADFKTWWVEKGTHAGPHHAGTQAHHVLTRTLYRMASGG